MITIITLGIFGISFAIDNISTTTENRFRWMIYTCDGWSETKVWNATSCKPYSLWKEYATNWCPAGSKLSSFSTIDDCSSMVWSSAVAIPPIIVPPTTISPVWGAPTLITIPTITPINTEQPKYIDINLPVADKILETFIEKHPNIKQEVNCMWLKYYVGKIVEQTKTVLGIPNAERDVEIKSHFKELLYNYLKDILGCDNLLPKETETATTIGKPNMTKTENYFRWIVYACDSWPETELWKEDSCKPYPVWKDFAVSQCSTADKLSTFIPLDACGSTTTTPTLPANEKPTIIEKPTNIEKPMPTPTPTPTTTTRADFFKWITYTCGDWSENEESDENVCQLYSLLKESAMNYCSEKDGLAKLSTMESCSPTSQEETKAVKLETERAYEYATEKGITTQPTLQTANAQGELTRGDMAKMIVKFSEKILDKTPDTSKHCVFNDIATNSDEIQNYIIESCQLWLMGQWINNFYPNSTVTRAQFATTLSRTLYGDTYEWGTVYYEWHLSALKDAGIINNIDSPFTPEIRWYVWMMMQRADEKFKFENSEEETK